MRISKQLKVGDVYTFHHVRKGTFVGQLIGVEKADPEDEADDLFLTVKYDVRVGTGQEHMKTTGVDIRVSNLRPSLLVAIDDYDGKSWLLQKKAPKQPRPDTELLQALRELTEEVKKRNKGE